MIAAYKQYWRVNILTLLEYRANFVMWFGFTLVYHAVALGALYVTMRTFPSMDGWNFKQMFFLYALWMCGHELHNLAFFQVNFVPEYVRAGQFDRFLVRPLDTLFQVLTVPNQTAPDGLLLSIVTLVFATVVGGVRVDWVYLLFVPLVVIGGALIDLGVSLTIATISFWVVRVDTLRWVAMGLEQDFTRYPISIYGRTVQIVMAFILPFAFMNYFPATFFLRKSEAGLNLSPWIGLLTPAIGLAWFGASYALWLFGLRHYQGTGS
jgi:ABC-2 type transport system permease protein